MEKFDDLKPRLPLTFQRTEIKKHNSKIKKTTLIAVKHIYADGIAPYNFYRPISKIVSI
ncbi:hypothetical protein U6A24_02120 [Aquimarina gracilis]|uniref:Uncharacterized protein n=1 Tax=Aquimarina gracilis TaxID=874422 RepID=A0ABU5ZQ75_9FLAO|nr:hypothetical protein [Aquimarina gracilis]MEB3344234.1 hypothetical protein [Aquimarina gracilis]